MKKLKPYIIGCWYSLPVQLLLLHFKRYPVLLVFWFVLFSTVNGGFMHRFGAHMLYLYPEYLGNVNALSLSLVGAAVAIFIMSWNITTFILHAKHIRFLATTTQPFLKYCINNGILPLLFLGFYFIKSFQYDRSQELLSYTEILLLAGGFFTGFAISIALGFTYFFGADKTLYRFMSPIVKQELQRHKNKFEIANPKRNRDLIRVDWYLSATLKLRRPRSVKHYTGALIDRIFKQHHLVALFSILIAFLSLIVTGFFLDNIYFQLPAAASITVFFAILIAVAGAFAYFLESWSLLFLLVLFLGFNFLYQKNILDARNKAYGISYNNKQTHPVYNRKNLNQTANGNAVQSDSLAFINILNTWKKKQGLEKPEFFIACVSGGGTRAAAFTVNVLSQLDSITAGAFSRKTFLVTGASGGMMGAAWYRELILKNNTPIIDKEVIKKYTDDISGDLLNPIFTSLVARDLLAPPQRFTYENNQYIKDRGYAFEEKLNSNTHGWLNKSIRDYKQAEDSAIVPRLIFNAVITRDGRKLVIGTRPSRFMMHSLHSNQNDTGADIDAIDFMSFFCNQQPGNLRLLSALRMNATFPYILPNVWLPTNPVVDVMDAGFRDNTGVESGLKFLYYFKDWLKENCSKVVLVQISDKVAGGWDNPYESNSIADLFTKPALLTQTNLFRFQEYGQLNQLEWFHHIYGNSFNRVLFTYRPNNKDAAASLSFHLTQREKKDLKLSLMNTENSNAFNKVQLLLK
ncbi:MAG: hypothetical protein V4717_01535 [Bacteroidota bacterium]